MDTIVFHTIGMGHYAMTIADCVLFAVLILPALIAAISMVVKG